MDVVVGHAMSGLVHGVCTFDRPLRMRMRRTLDHIKASETISTNFAQKTKRVVVLAEWFYVSLFLWKTVVIPPPHAACAFMWERVPYKYPHFE